MKKRGKKNFIVVPINDSNKQLSKTRVDVRPHGDIAITPSPEGWLTVSGFKCEHGVYIPATSESSDHAPYCSLCYPYVLDEI